MNLLYANPLTLGLHYLLLMFLGTPMEKLFYEFYSGMEKSFEGDRSTTDQAYDFVVVGGGSTGAVVASRLSENGNFSVLLIEAGGFPFPLTIVPALSVSPALLNNPMMNWADNIAPQTDVLQAVDQDKLTFRRPKVVGGGSVTNFIMFMRGSPKDYDRWANVTGDESWTYQNLLPLFKKLENYNGPRRNESYHSNSGPMHGQVAADTLPLVQEYIRAGKELGFEQIDPNSFQAEGVYQVVNTAKDGRRWTTNDGYIYPALLRPNFQIEINAEVTQILLSPENQVEGVLYTKNHKNYTVRVKKEIIVSAGAVGSPKLLLLSGIGPKDHLKSVGIPVKVDLPAVGQNMQDHIMFFLGPFIYNKTKSSGADYNNDVSLKSVQDFIAHGKGPLATTPILTGGHFFSSSAKPGQGNPDLIHLQLGFKLGPQTTANFEHLLRTRPGILEKYMQNDYGRDSFVMLASPALPKSLGEVKLKSNDPFDPPIFDPKYFSHQEDVKTVIEGLKLAFKFVDTEPYKNIDARLMSTPFPGCEAHAADLRSDAYITCFARHLAISMWHFSCTCAMGKGSETSTSVVDSKLRVHGVKGLRVADASVMPFLVNANSNIPCVLIGEKAADEITRFWSAK